MKTTYFLSLVLFHACINILAEKFLVNMSLLSQLFPREIFTSKCLLKDILMTRNSQKPLPFCEFATVTF